MSAIRPLSMLLLPLLLSSAALAAPRGPRSGVEIATRYLAGPGAALAAGADLDLARVQRSPLGEHVTFRQVVDGEPVLGGWVRVHVDPLGRAFGGWSTVTDAVSSEVVWTPAQARAEALALLGDPVLLPQGVQVERGATPSGTVYRVTVSASEPLGVWQVDLHATTGALVAPIEDVAAYVTGVGQVYHVSASVALETNDLVDRADRASAIPTEAYVAADLPELDGSGYLVGPYVEVKSLTPRSWTPFNAGNQFMYDRQANEFEGVMAYWALDYAQRYIQSLGFDDVNNRQLRLAVNTSPADNSFYSAGSITLGSGGVDDGEDAEVIWHEMGHAIHADQVPGWGTSQDARSMGEGFGDFIGASVSAVVAPGWQEACVAEWDAVSYSNTRPPCLRRTDGDKVYPDDLVGEVHADGEIWSGALWDIRAWLGNDETLSVLLASHFLLGPSATMPEAAAAFLDAGQQMGLSAAELSRADANFADHGLR